MKKFLKIIKWLTITIFTIVVLSILYLRFSRFSDKIIYQMNGTDYFEFKSELNYEEFYFDVDNDVKLHGVLFKPDSIYIYRNNFSLCREKDAFNVFRSRILQTLLKKGFQVFCFERRNFGKSNGEANNSLSLKKDALFIFDKNAEMNNISGKPIVIWGNL